MFDITGPILQLHWWSQAHSRWVQVSFSSCLLHKAFDGVLTCCLLHESIFFILISGEHLWSIKMEIWTTPWLESASGKTVTSTSTTCWWACWLYSPCQRLKAGHSEYASDIVIDMRRLLLFDFVIKSHDKKKMCHYILSYSLSFKGHKYIQYLQHSSSLKPFIKRRWTVRLLGDYFYLRINTHLLWC